jgi:protein O-mannosyl-transferase
MSKEKLKKSGKAPVAKPLLDEKRKEWLLVAFILAITFLIFSPAIRYDFVDWDDDTNITINPNMEELNASTIRNIFTSTVIGGYTPLTTLSFAIENQIFGMKPGVFHFNNILLHLLCTLLVFVLLRKFGLNLFIAFAVTLLFGIHPMRVESVVWITERKDLLYSFFFLLALLFYHSWYKTKRLIFYVLALLAFVFSLLSKIQAVTLPLILLLIDYFYERKFQLRQIYDKIPFFLLSLATGLAGIYFLGERGALEIGTDMPFIQRIFIGTFSLCVYLIKSIVPWEMSAIYPYPEKLSILHYASAVVVILLAVLLYKTKKYRTELIFGSLFFLFNVIFMLQIVGAGQAFLADRFTYIAYIGLFYLIVNTLNSLLNGKWKNRVIIAGILYLAILGTITSQRIKVWENTETLFSDVISKYPESTISYNNLGVYYRNQKQNDKAIAAYDKSIEIDPDGFVSYSNRGEVYFELGKVDQAIQDMNKAIKLKPDYAKAWSNRGAAWGSKNEFNLALIDLDQAIVLDPENLSSYANRILVHYSLGNFDLASRDATTYLQKRPEEADIMNMRGLCLSRLEKNQEALADFSRSIELNPRASAYYKNRSALYYKIGDKQKALNDIRKAGELGTKVDPEYLKLLETN